MIKIIKIKFFKKKALINNLIKSLIKRLRECLIQNYYQTKYLQNSTNK
jgi:hypothetical protein